MSNIVSGNMLAEHAALMGDPARANMLIALMAGQALTAGELAANAGVTAQTASGHLAKMVQSSLLAVEKQGRHRYYRLAGPSVAQALETLMALSAQQPQRQRRVGPKDVSLRTARTCYDHIAGRLGVALADGLQHLGYVELSEGAASVTRSGHDFFCDFGIRLSENPKRGRPLCRTCLDWSERRPHLAGRLGADLLERMLTLGWVARLPQSRALRITPKGQAGLSAHFSMKSDWSAEPTNQ
ncbi:ArsR/SmtB family transcription factor [Rhizobium oryziradicis]|uniref:Transcriptional regulator n=1 Tax=Rhizobium oryziradicis TaxID=1867956 RepID=A0A1Q8ZUF1_9HYPH|nr:helix-turn-helix transcriptional regulator [Rhizobium oryziradicis]OLP45607.1 transcriptional regulator [Rhizobium oryziradicis]